jgi:predicted metal-binding membrane protein
MVDLAVARLRRRTVVAIGGALLVASALAWVVVVDQSHMGSMNSSMGSTGSSMGSSTSGMSDAHGSWHVLDQLTMGMRGWLFVGVWVAMMVAMMFPTALPMILTFARVQSGRQAQGRPYVPTAIFVATYLAIWAAFGVLAYLAADAAGAWADHHHLTQSTLARVGGAVIVLAGVYQITPWKRRCLSRCRNPLDFVLGSWRQGWGGAVRMGAEHGLWCVGCCWLLFVLLFPLGIMNVALMAGVTLLIFVEKVWRRGAETARLVGVLTVVAGLIVSLVPDLLPTTLAPV